VEGATIKLVKEGPMHCRRIISITIVLATFVLITTVEADNQAGPTNVINHGAIPDDGKDDSSAVEEAIRACSLSATKTLHFPGGTFDIASVTFPSMIGVELSKGAILKLHDDATVKFEGAFVTGLYQIFSGNGNVRFGPGAVSEVYPQW